MSINAPTPKFKPGDLIRFRGYQQGAVAFLMYGVAIGALFAAMLPDLGWSLHVASTALLVRGLLGIPCGPFTGWLVERFGIRPVVMIGAVGTAVSTVLTATVTHPVTFVLLFGVAITFADQLVGYLPAVTVVNRWFLTRRGVMLGIVKSAGGFGGLVFAPLMAVLIHRFGWRAALVILGIVIFVLCIPTVFLRNEPRDVGQWVDGVEGRVVPEHGGTDDIGTVQVGAKSAIRTPLFWLVFATFGVEAWALGVYSAYQVVYLETVGVAALASSSALGVSAGVAGASGLILSRLSDRISPYYVLIGSNVLMLAGSFAFLGARGPVLLWTYSVLFGAGYGLLVPTIPAAVGRYFGARGFGNKFGIGMAVGAVGGGVGPYITGVIADATGSFTVPIYLITGLLAVSVVLSILARPHRNALRAVSTRTDATPTVEPAEGSQSLGSTN